MDTLIQRKKQNAPILSSLRTLKFLRGWGDYKKFTRGKISNVPLSRAGKLIFNIDTDGSITGCDFLTHKMKNNPNSIDLGFKKAFKVVMNPGSKTCTCAQHMYYNYMFSFSLDVILNWMSFVFVR